MINLLLGAPGGGKSYEAVVFHVLPALQKGRKVVTNLPLVVEAFAAIEPAYADLIELRTKSKGAARKDAPARVFSRAEDFADDWRHAEGFGPLYVVDECHFAMPKGQTDVEVEEWFSMHRHYNADVLLITQSYGKISQAIRDLVQMVYRVRKNVALGSTGSYTRKVQDGLRGEVVNTTIRKYQSQYFGLYKSHTRGQAVDEFNASDVRPLWKNWTFLGAGISIFTVIALFGSGAARVPWKVDKQATVQKDVSHPPLTRPAPIPAQIAASPASSASSAEVAHAKQVAAPEPFAGRGLHLTGYMEMRGRLIWTFQVSQNGQPVAAITDADLRAAGYTWTGEGHCSGLLVFGEIKRAVICDSPQVGPSIPMPKSEKSA